MIILLIVNNVNLMWLGKERRSRDNMQHFLFPFTIMHSIVAIAANCVLSLCLQDGEMERHLILRRIYLNCSEEQIVFAAYWMGLVEPGWQMLDTCGETLLSVCKYCGAELSAAGVNITNLLAGFIKLLWLAGGLFGPYWSHIFLFYQYFCMC